MLEWVYNEVRTEVWCIGSVRRRTTSSAERTWRRRLWRDRGDLHRATAFLEERSGSGAAQATRRTVQITLNDGSRGQHGRARQARARRDVRGRVHGPLRARCAFHRPRPVRGARFRQLSLQPQIKRQPHQRPGLPDHGFCTGEVGEQKLRRAVDDRLGIEPDAACGGQRQDGSRSALRDFSLELSVIVGRFPAVPCQVHAYFPRS